MELEKAVERMLNKDESIINENANKDARVIGTQRDLLAGAVSKEYAIHKLLPSHVAEAHTKGWIHFHDLDYTLTGYFNCMLIDFPGMLANGFMMGSARIEPPRSLRTAAEVIPQIVVGTSSNMYGGLSAHKIDEILEPYAELSYLKHLKHSLQFASKFEGVELTTHELDQLALALKDEVTPNPQSRLSDSALRIVIETAKKDMLKEIYDSAQSLEYELNSCFSASGQQPFVTFNFGMTTSWLGREIQKAILQVRLDGLGKEKTTAVFPKLVFTLKPELNMAPGEPNYDIKLLAMECTSKRIYPDYLSYDKVIETWGFFVSPMGCRSFLSYHEDKNGEPMSYGRRNMGVCTLNIPNIAMSVESIEDFWGELEKRALIAKDALLYRYQKLGEITAQNAPIIYQYGAAGHRLEPDANVQHIFKDGEASASLGYIGLSEAATRFFGYDWEQNSEAKQFTLDVLRHLNTLKDQWTEETGIGFSVYGTPAESLTDRFARMDKETFGDVEHITDKGWYTNSFHFRPDKQITPFEKFDFEAPYPALSTGGNICYVEVPSLVKNLSALETLIDYASDRIPYFGINSPISKCHACGFDQSEFDADAIGFFCPECGSRDITCIQRLCGYISEVHARKPIRGRVKEMTSRVKHMGNEA